MANTELTVGKRAINPLPTYKEFIYKFTLSLQKQAKIIRGQMATTNRQLNRYALQGKGDKYVEGQRRQKQRLKILDSINDMFLMFHEIEGRNGSLAIERIKPLSQFPATMEVKMSGGDLTKCSQFSARYDVSLNTILDDTEDYMENVLVENGAGITHHVASRIHYITEIERRFLRCVLHSVLHNKSEKMKTKSMLKRIANMRHRYVFLPSRMKDFMYTPKIRTRKNPFSLEMAFSQKPVTHKFDDIKKTVLAPDSKWLILDNHIFGVYPDNRVFHFLTIGSAHYKPGQWREYKFE